MPSIILKNSKWVVVNDSREWEFDSLTSASAALKVVLKHGNHDQSSHGGGKGSVDGGVPALAQQRLKESGGLSIKMTDGSEPPDGFMVAKGDGFGKIVDAKEFYDPVQGPKIISGFVKEHKADLGSGKSYLGLWHNSEDGKVYLDVSDNFKIVTPAKIAGSQRNQISIWDITNSKEIPTGGTGELTKDKSVGSGEDSREPIGNDGQGNRPMGDNSVGKSGEATRVTVELIRYV